MYPESWGESADTTTWGNQWITDHATSQKSANKPVLMEEFGVTIANQSTVYTTWYNTVVSSGLSGDLIWCASNSGRFYAKTANLGMLQASGLPSLSWRHTE